MRKKVWMMNYLAGAFVCLVLCGCTRSKSYSDLSGVDWQGGLTEGEAIVLVKNYCDEQLGKKSIILLPFNNEGDIYAQNTIDPSSGGYILWKAEESSSISYTARIDVDSENRTIQLSVGKNL